MALPLKLDTTSGTPAMFPFKKVKSSYRSCHNSEIDLFQGWFDLDLQIQELLIP